MTIKSHTQTDKHTLVTLLFLISIVIIPTSNSCSPDQKPEAVEAWIKSISNAKEKITKLHFYWHESSKGKTPTAFTIANSSTTTSPSEFRYTAITDVPLRSGPEPTSKLVGHAQGLFAFADQQEVGVFMALNYVFTDGEFKGSTLSLLGRNPFNEMYREMPVLGGTGVFRLARGIATLKTYYYNSTSGYGLVEYNVVVLHY